MINELRFFLFSRGLDKTRKMVKKVQILNEKSKTRTYSLSSLFQGLIIIVFVCYNIDFLIDINFFIFFTAVTQQLQHIILHI